MNVILQVQVHWKTERGKRRKDEKRERGNLAGFPFFLSGSITLFPAETHMWVIEVQKSPWDHEDETCQPKMPMCKDRNGQSLWPLLTSLNNHAISEGSFPDFLLPEKN